MTFRQTNESPSYYRRILSKSFVDNRFQPVGVCAKLLFLRIVSVVSRLN